MNKPIIITVDDDQVVLKAIDRDLQIRYGKDYRIISINMGTAALDFLERTQPYATHWGVDGGSPLR